MVCQTCCLCLHSLLKTSAKFVRILEQVKALYCVSGFHWSALKFSQTSALSFTRLWRHGKHVLFLKLIGCAQKLLSNYLAQVLFNHVIPEARRFSVLTDKKLKVLIISCKCLFKCNLMNHSSLMNGDGQVDWKRLSFLISFNIYSQNFKNT